VFDSDSFDPEFQLYCYDDWSIFPTKEVPLRPPAQGVRHKRYVPVCYRDS
jgi:hypothetical protein